MTVLQQDIQDGLQTATVGNDVRYLSRAVKSVGRYRKRTKLAETVSETHGVDLDDATASLLIRVSWADSPNDLLDALTMLGYTPESDYESEDVPEVFDSFGSVLNHLNQSLNSALAVRNGGAASASSKRNRTSVYIPSLMVDVGDADVYMAKSLTSEKKIRLAWAIDENNAVVRVDDYGAWEDTLGWKKLKDLPYGRDSVSESFGHILSEDEIETILGLDDTTPSTTTNRTTTRTTKTYVADKTMTIGASTSHRTKTTVTARHLRDALISDGFLDARRYRYNKIILFPSSTDEKISGNWHLAGPVGDGDICIGMANCTNKVYDFLKDLPQVTSIDDYKESATGYQFDTSEGVHTLESLDLSRVVFHTVEKDTKQMFLQPTVAKHVRQNMSDMSTTYRFHGTIPEPDSMIYVPLEPSDMANLRVSIRDLLNTDGDEGPFLLRGDYSPSGIDSTGMYTSSDATLYMMSRLHRWDMDSPAMRELRNARIDLNDGGYELIEMLGARHDNGQPVITGGVGN